MTYTKLLLVAALIATIFTIIRIVALRNKPKGTETSVGLIVLATILLWLLCGATYLCER